MTFARRRVSIVLALAALGVSALAAGQARPRSASFISPSEIRPGMRGYGLTVFRGTTPERFDVEVIDVLTNFRPDQDLILIRTPHPILNSAHVVAGMSGSPIYLDNRLAGAYAYGWPFSSDPVAGVTPIEPMALEMRRPLRALPVTSPLPPRRRGRTSELAAPRTDRLAGLPPYLGQTPVHATSALEAYAALHGTRRASNATLAPAATPLLIGGLDESVIRMLDEQLDDFGLMVLQAGGGGRRQAPASAPARYQHGSAVGVQLIRGDVSATAVGTVTHVEGNRVAAFGHPMLNGGEMALPTALSRVLHILSSSNRSFKIAEPVTPLGSLIHDRQSAVVVDTNVRPELVPVRVRIRGVTGAPRTEWNMEVASHRLLTPALVNAAISNALGATVADTSDVMFEATGRIRIAGRREPIEVTDRGFSRGGATSPMALGQLRLFTVLEMAYGNPFEDARVQNVEVDFDLRFERDTVQIIDASVSAREVDPGSTVSVRIVLRRFGHPEEVRVVPLRIPERVAGETITITIEGGGAVNIETLSPRNLDELLSIVHQRYPPTSMVVSLDLPTRGLRFAGHIVRDLPRSALDTLQLRNDADRNRPFVTHDRREIPLGDVVSGSASIELSVRRRPRQ